MIEPATITVTRTSGPNAGPINVAIPRELGPLRLLHEIGRGGMGVVYLAHHQLLHKAVAVKFLNAAADNAEEPGFRRFLDEARAAAAVEHPGLTTIHHADVFEGIPYLVNEYVNGPTLRQLITRFPKLDPPAVIAVMDAMSAAVGELHRRGVVHRDIKPGNVLLDREGRVFVTDFGLACAKAAEQAPSLCPGLAGTPAYMAPEMFDGVASPRTDVYAMGVVMYELLTGEVPIHGTLDDVAASHRRGEVLFQALPRVSADPAMVELIERAVHKNALFRYKDAGHFQQALRRCGASAESLSAGVRSLQSLLLRLDAAEPIQPAPDPTPHTPTGYYDRLTQIAKQKRTHKSGDTPN